MAASGDGSFDMGQAAALFGAQSGGDQTSADPAAAEAAKPEKGVVGWLKSFFSIHTLIRATAIIAGLILIVLSIAVLVGRSSTGQTLVTNTVKKVAGPKAAGVASEVADNVVAFAAAA